MTFSANSEHLLSGGRDHNVQVWRVQDGQRVGTIEVKDVLCLAVSQNGKWIAGGTWNGDVFVWDAETYERVWKLWLGSHINAVHFSPDSTKLVSGTSNYTATIWDVASGKKIRTLQHNHGLIAAGKFSSDSDRLATATHYSVQVWDNHGQLLLGIPVVVSAGYNHGLWWFSNHIFVVSNNKVKQLDASTGSTVSEWSVPDSDLHSCIAIPRHGKFVVYSTSRSVTLWDTSIHSQIGLVEHTGDIRSIALSPDDRSLAIGGENGTITIKSLSRSTVSIVSR